MVDFHATQTNEYFIAINNISDTNFASVIIFRVNVTRYNIDNVRL